MEMDLKTREYKLLCQKLDELKENKIDENDGRLMELKEDFQKNYEEIVEINKQLKILKSIQDEQGNKTYQTRDLFKKANNSITSKEINKSLTKVEKENIFKRIYKKIKDLLIK